MPFKRDWFRWKGPNDAIALASHRGERGSILSRRWSCTFRLVDWSEAVWQLSTSHTSHLMPGCSPRLRPVTTLNVQIRLAISHICQRALRGLWEPFPSLRLWCFFNVFSKIFPRARSAWLRQQPRHYQTRLSSSGHWRGRTIESQRPERLNRWCMALRAACTAATIVPPVPEVICFCMFVVFCLRVCGPNSQTVGWLDDGTRSNTIAPWLAQKRRGILIR